MDEQFEQELSKKSEQLHVEITRLIDGLSRDRPRAANEKSTVELKLLINEFEPLPQLLDIQLPYYIDKLLNIYLQLYKTNTINGLTNNIGEIIYNLAKIRGFKHITYYFSSDVYLIPSLIDILSKLENDNEIFLIHMWLSNLVLVPFNLDQIKIGLTKLIFQIGLSNLNRYSNASKNQLVCLILLSRLITRVDLLRDNWLTEYFEIVKNEWSKQTYKNGAIKSGHLLTINKILKRCPSDYIYPHLYFIHDIIHQDLTILRYYESDFTNLNVLYHIKILSKLCNLYLIDANYDKISEIINNLVHDIMNLKLDRFDTELRYAMAKSLSNISYQLLLHAINYQEQLINYLINELQIPNLSDSFTNLQIDPDQITITKYHTVLLFLGYITLNKTLPKHFIPKVLSIVHKTLFIEQRRLNTTVGSQLRDSSCFIIWSLCRFITPDQFKLSMKNPEMMETIFYDLIVATIFDNELIIRRCGIAVIQEFVGRSGNFLFIKDDLEEKGKFLVSLVEIFSNKLVGTHSLSFGLIPKLIEVGFSKHMFIPVLLNKINDVNVNLATKLLCSRYLKIVMKVDGDGELNFNPSSIKTYSDQDILDSLEYSDESLYFISDILEVYPDESRIHDLISRVSSFDFEWHSDSLAKALGYLKWTDFLVSRGQKVQSWNQLFNLVKMNNIELVALFQQLFDKVNEIPDDTISNAIHYLKNDNLVIAKSVFYYKFFSEAQLNQVLVLLQSNISCEVKASMIECLQARLNLYPQIELEEFFDLLDDYTITNQGDVGSKVRYATLKLIKEYKNRVLNHEVLNAKLIRLSGEVIDKIRFEAFSILTNEENFQLLSVSRYYEALFNYYAELDESFKVEFWKGVGFSIATTTGASSNINDSFREFVKFYCSLGETSRLDVLNELIKLLKIDSIKLESRQLKLYNMILNLFIKIFESSLPIPLNFNYEVLYIRGYNLHINTTNMTRISMVLRIFQYLALSSDVNVSLKLKRRVIWLSCNHKMPKVREIASEIIFEIINEEAKLTHILDEIDWTESSAELKKYVLPLEKLLINDNR